MYIARKESAISYSLEEAGAVALNVYQIKECSFTAKTCLHFLQSYFQVMCEKMGGNLLEIDGPLEGQYITSQVKLFNSK